VTRGKDKFNLILILIKRGKDLPHDPICEQPIHTAIPSYRWCRFHGKRGDDWR